MTSISIYFLKNKFVIPTDVITDSNIQMSTEPVAIIDVSNREELIRVLEERIQGENVIIPAPRLKDFNKITSVVHKAAKIRSWKKFQEAVYKHFSLWVRDFSIVYTPWHMTPDGRGWEPNEDDMVKINSKNPEVVADFILNKISDLIDYD